MMSTRRRRDVKKRTTRHQSRSSLDRGSFVRFMSIDKKVHNVPIWQEIYSTNILFDEVFPVC